MINIVVFISYGSGDLDVVKMKYTKDNENLKKRLDDYVKAHYGEDAIYVWEIE